MLFFANADAVADADASASATVRASASHDASHDASRNAGLSHVLCRVYQRSAANADASAANVDADADADASASATPLTSLSLLFSSDSSLFSPLSFLHILFLFPQLLMLSLSRSAVLRLSLASHTPLCTRILCSR